MRQLKTFMRNRKAEMLWCGPCECRTLQCWRYANENCGCGEENGLEWRAERGQIFLTLDWESWLIDNERDYMAFLRKWNQRGEIPYAWWFNNEALYEEWQSGQWWNVYKHWYFVLNEDECNTILDLLDRARELPDASPIKLTSQETAIIMKAYKQLNKELLSFRARNTGTEQDSHWVLDLVDTKWNIVWTFNWDQFTLNNWVYYVADDGWYVDDMWNEAIELWEDEMLSYYVSESMRHWLSLNTVPFVVDWNIYVEDMETPYYSIDWEDIVTVGDRLLNDFHYSNDINMETLDDWRKFTVLRDFDDENNYIELFLSEDRSITRRNAVWHWTRENSSMVDFFNWLSDEVRLSSFINCGGGMLKLTRSSGEIIVPLYYWAITTQEAIAEANELVNLTECSR